MIKQDVDEEVERWNFQTPHLDSWLSTLMNAVAKNNMCQVVQGKGFSVYEKKVASKEIREFYLFGKKPNLEVVTYMYQYLAAEIDRLTPPKQSSSCVSSFRLGAVVVIAERLREELSAFQDSPESNALVVVSEAALVEKVKQEFPNLGKGRRTTISDNGAYRDGKEAGRSIAFRKGVEGNNGSKVLIGI